MEVAGVEGNSPTHDSLMCSQLDLRTVSFRSSCLWVPAFQELATAAAPPRADLHTRHRHGARQEETERNGGGLAPKTGAGGEEQGARSHPGVAMATDNLQKAGQAGGCGRAATSSQPLPLPNEAAIGQSWGSSPPHTSPFHQLSLRSSLRSPPRPARQ